MKDDPCGAEPLFSADVQPAFQDFLDKMFEGVSAAATESLRSYRATFSNGISEPSDLHRVLADAASAAVPNTLTFRTVAPIVRALNGPVPCNSTALAARIGNAGIRGPEQDLLFVAAYGFRHGLTADDLAMIPATSITFTFGLDRDFTTANLISAELNLTNQGASQVKTNGTSAKVTRDGGLAKAAAAVPALTAGEIIIAIATLGISELFKRCFKSDLEDLTTALKKGDKKKARELAQEFRNNLEEHQREIEDKQKELNRQPSSDDKTQQQNELNQDRQDTQKLLDGINQLIQNLGPAPSTPPK
jgi:hypothetical protein